MGEGRPDPRFVIVGVTDTVWREYCSWFEKRGVPPPPYVADSIFVADDTWLLAGCCIYPCDGPFAVVEFLATNPIVPGTRPQRAVHFGIKYLTAYGAMRKKTMLCVSTKAVAAMLRRAGYHHVQSTVMVHGPWTER